VDTSLTKQQTGSSVFIFSTVQMAYCAALWTQAEPNSKHDQSVFLFFFFLKCCVSLLDSASTLTCPGKVISHFNGGQHTPCQMNASLVDLLVIQSAIDN
jgi:hypothetical protein